MEFLSEIKGLNLICEFFIKSSTILATTFILVFLFRKKSASLRHFLVSASLISLLLFPFFSFFTTGWETGLIPTLQTEKSRDQLSQRSDQLSVPASLSEAVSIHSTDQQLSSLNLEKSRFFNSFLSKYSLSKGFIGISLMAIWAAGLLILLARIVIGLFGAFKLTRQGQKISASSWRKLLNHFLESISIKRKIGLFSHKNVNIPLTCGVIKPVVLLPSESKNWTQDQRSSALFHELSHIKRGDFLINILARCSLALYWFNPLSWFAFRMLKKEQEKACDELVLKAGVKPSTYAVNLLSIKNAGQFQWNPPTAALGAVGKSQLNERLIAILKQQLKPKEVNMKTKILLSSLIIMSITFIGLARPSQSEAYTDRVLSPENLALSHNPDVIQETTDQEKQVKKITVKTDKEESEDQTKKTITWVSEDGKKIELIIYTDENGETKVTKVDGDKLIEIEKDPDGNSFTLRIDDKNVVLHEQDGGHWSLHSDEKEALQYHLSSSHEHDKQYSVVYMKKGDKDNKNEFYVKADKIQVEKIEKPYKVVNIHVTPDIKIPGKAIDIYISGEEGEKKKIKIAPHVDVHMA
ncbi:M56 family metallopeptidase, partial [Acidobacteriota bacterium]